MLDLFSDKLIEWKKERILERIEAQKTILEETKLEVRRRRDRYISIE